MGNELLNQVEQKLELCLSKDRFSFQRRLNNLRRNTKAKDYAQQIERLQAQVEQSQKSREKRQASIPALTYPDLPVSDKKAEIAEAISNNQVVIICGETGSGKTTQLPKICLELGLGVAGVIAHTQPRRIAARAVADRIASEIGQPLGELIGYKIRFQDQSKPETLVKLLTDGILLAEIQADPYLNQYDTIIIDEAHERSLNIDFLLGYLKWLLPKRRDLKVIVTSATIDPERFSRHFFNAPIIEVSGRTYPVEIRYHQADEDEDEDSSNDKETSSLFSEISQAVKQLYRETEGDILIFMSGERDIRELSDYLAREFQDRYEILPLFSRLSQAEQQRIFRRGAKRRIVISTNVAETSLTVPGIHSVIDTGKARISRYSHRNKLQRLPVEKIAKASANQRSGRCGRVAAGICIRMYSEEDFNVRPEFTEPEILRTNLASVILQMTALGLGDISRFPFVDRPSEKMIKDGYRLLQELNAVDAQKKITETGRQLARFPVDPRLGRMLLAAVEENCLAEVLVIVAALSIQDPRERPLDAQQAADQKHAQYRVEGSDLLTLVNLWRTLETQKATLSVNQFKRYCRDNFLSFMRVREWADVYQQLHQLAVKENRMHLNKDEAKQDAVHRALLPGLLSQIGFRHDKTEYLGARNLKFQIHPGSTVHRSKPKWILACEQVETTRTYARNVANIDPVWVEHAASHLLHKQYYDPHWEKKAGRAAIFERVTLYGLTLAQGRRVPYENIDPVATREMFIRFALVYQDFNTTAKFFRKNQELLTEVGYLEDKGRRVDLVVDEEWLFDFYNERLPDSVVNSVTFHQWLEAHKPHNENRLILTREAITQQQASEIDHDDYPDFITCGGLVIQLRYRFEPGHQEDGVSAIVPIHQLNQLRSERFQWLVPGLLEEKVTAMIKALPKSIRRNFVPAPDFARKALPLIQDNDAQSITQALSDALYELSRVKIANSSWNFSTISEHLKMNFIVLADDGKQLGQSRDLEGLQRQYASQAGKQFNALAEASLAYTDCQDWVFEEVPEIYQGERNGKQISGFPAVVDENSSVGVRIFDSLKRAQAAHRAGVTRLLALKLKKDVRYLQKQASPQMAMVYQRLGASPFLRDGVSNPEDSYVDELIDCVLAQVFVDGKPAIRSAEQLESRIKQEQQKLVSVFAEVNQNVESILAKFQAIKASITGMALDKAIAKDLNRQLDFMIYKGFLLETPFEFVEAFPRFLRAIDMRLEKAMQAPHKDLQRIEQVDKFWQPFLTQVNDGVISSPAAHHFRWAIEEFRVSLFAQNLKTAFPVSEKRLSKLWLAETE